MINEIIQIQNKTFDNHISLDHFNKKGSVLIIWVQSSKLSYSFVNKESLTFAPVLGITAPTNVIPINGPPMMPNKL